MYVKRYSINMESKYNLLLEENDRLKQRIKTLNEQQLILKHRTKSASEYFKRGTDDKGQDIVESKTKTIYGNVDVNDWKSTREKMGGNIVTSKTTTYSIKRKFAKND